MQVKKRLKKKKEKIVRREIHNLLDAILDINGIAERKQEVSGNLPTAFFEFSGHVALAHFFIYDRGWYTGADPDLSVYVNLVPTKLSEATNRLKRKYGGTL